MARKTSLVSLNQISDINMTPLMDLTFILLITFIITFPLIEEAIPIRLPKGNASDMSTVVESRSISLDRTGQLYLDDDPIAMESLLLVMKDVAAFAPDTTVYVRADYELQYGKVAEVMKILHDAGVTRAALAMEAE
ncbi:MAG: biopolymer transporter ExbD [Lentisphaerae bacterium]|nr:biopolymer transporter ExbD [Lentisphaerota bacterium]